MAATPTEFLYTVTSGSTNYFTFNGSGWGVSSQSGAFGGSYNSTSNPTDSVTINWTGKALYLNTAASVSTNCSLTVVTDGGASQVIYPSNTASTGGIALYQLLIPIVRNLTDGAHVTTITLNGGGTNPRMYVNSGVAITGTPSTATNPLAYCVVGDSWGAGRGAANSTLAYPQVVQQQLSNLTNSNIIVTNSAISGSGYSSCSGSTTTPFWRQLLTTVQPVNPGYLSIVGGTNDVRQAQSGFAKSPSSYGYDLRTTMLFIQDMFAVSNMNIVVSTPQFCTAYYAQQSIQVNGQTPTQSNYYSGGVAQYETCVQVARQILQQFPWVKIADAYGIFNGNTDLLLPNSNLDFGLHPNDSGHGVLANEIFRAFMST